MIGTLPDERGYRPDDGTTTENLCLDAGHVGKAVEVSARGHIPHICPRGEEISEAERNPDFIPRRWVAECFHSWSNRFLVMRRTICPVVPCLISLPP
ncbi:MAG: hypothetical protein LBI59_11100 [Candidatus Accumulibacter sp.]|jgi:hypothetical protein|nr:hypothetical protein [Accumulibacter sp.]